MKTNQQNEALRAEFSKQNEHWDEAFNRQQATVVASFYDDEATVMPAGGAQVSCGKAILDFWRNTISKGIVDHRIDLLEVGADGEYAFQRGLWSAAMVNSQGERTEFSGNLHLLYRRQLDQSWKIFTHIWN